MHHHVHRDGPAQGDTVLLDRWVDLARLCLHVFGSTICVYASHPAQHRRSSTNLEISLGPWEPASFRERLSSENIGYFAQM
jgi:hypothetical protein